MSDPLHATAVDEGEADALIGELAADLARPLTELRYLPETLEISCTGEPSGEDLPLARARGDDDHASRDFAVTQAAASEAHAGDGAGHFGAKWTGPFDSAGAAKQASALDAFNTAATLTAPEDERGA